MTRPELHELVDIVMDAREKGIPLNILGIFINPNIYNSENIPEFDIWLSEFETFSDFTQAVKEYIKTLEG